MSNEIKKKITDDIEITITESYPPEDNSKYRYYWTCEWENGGGEGVVNFIGLNPSIASAKDTDRTIDKCIKIAHKQGYDRMIMTNLFGYRATDPDDLLSYDGDRVGTENDKNIRQAQEEANMVIVAWGDLGILDGRNKKILNILGKNIHCLGKTKKKENPCHPNPYNSKFLDTNPKLYEWHK